MASGSGWNLWVWLGGMYGCGYQEVGVVGRRRVWLAGGTALVSVLFCSSIPTSFFILLK